MRDYTTSELKRLLDRFYCCYDGLLRIVEVLYREGGAGTNARVVLSTRDNESDADDGWCNLEFDISDVLEFRLTESGSKGGYEVLSGGVAILPIQGMYFFEFTHAVEPEAEFATVDEVRRSEFYVAGRKFTWKTSAYSVTRR
ncbi:MAG TPA: hypothetical protein VND64_20940 [Pirellulales bacterium]|nr:hypothetical protein [Pirellulales bacterium]